MWIHWPFFPKTWTKGHWPLDDLWSHVCWGHMCDSTKDHCVQVPWQYINVCGYSDQFCKIPHTYTYINTHTTYRMSDHIVSYWTQFRRDKKLLGLLKCQCNFDFFEFLEQFTIRCICYISRCWLFWDRAQNMLIRGRRCSTPLME